MLSISVISVHIEGSDQNPVHRDVHFMYNNPLQENELLWHFDSNPNAISFDATTQKIDVRWGPRTQKIEMRMSSVGRAGNLVLP